MSPQLFFGNYTRSFTIGGLRNGYDRDARIYGSPFVGPVFRVLALQLEWGVGENSQEGNLAKVHFANLRKVKGQVSLRQAGMLPRLLHRRGCEDSQVGERENTPVVGLPQIRSEAVDQVRSIVLLEQGYSSAQAQYLLDLPGGYVVHDVQQSPFEGCLHQPGNLSLKRVARLHRFHRVDCLHQCTTLV